jgi:hypothetical protein
MKPPEKEKRGRKPRSSKPSLFALCQRYYVAAFFAKMFERPFWHFEQKRSQFWDELARLGFKP